MLTLDPKSTNDYNSFYTNAIDRAVTELAKGSKTTAPLYVVFRMTAGWKVVDTLPAQGCTIVYPNGNTEILEYSFHTRTHRIATPIPDGTLLPDIETP